MKEELDKESRAALVKYRMQRAKETLAEVPVLKENGFLSTAINRLYYASFYAASALLLNGHCNVSSHQGVKQLLGLHYISSGKISRELGRYFSQIFEARHSSDYDDFICTTIEEIDSFYPKAVEFIETIDSLLTHSEDSPN